MATEISPRDEALLRMAADGKSGLEMQQETGLSAPRAVLRVKELLKKRDVWSEIERRQLLMDELYALKNKLQAQNKDFINDKQADVLLKTINSIDAVLDKQGSITDDQLAKISQAQAQAMLMLIRSAFEHAKALLETDYPDVPVQQIEAAFRTGLEAQMDTLADSD